METTQVMVPTRFVVEVKQFIKDKLMQEYEMELELLGVISHTFKRVEPEAVPMPIIFTEAKLDIVAETLPEAKQASLFNATVKTKRSRKKSEYPIRKEMLKNSVSVLKSSASALTVNEMTQRLAPIYKVKGSAEFKAMEHSVSALLSGYTLSQKKPIFSRERDEKGNHIYTVRPGAEDLL